MQTPLVSIIIPTYNRAHLIGETLDSVLAQTYKNWECIVVDDGSTDGTAQLMQTYCEKDQRFQYHQRPANKPKGANACRNYGFELSKGEYINWFDDDDLMLENFLKVKLGVFAKNIMLSLCSGLIVDENKIIIGKLEVGKVDNIFKEYLLWHQQIITNSVMFKRYFLINKTLFNEKLVRGQEEDLFSRFFFIMNEEIIGFTKETLFLYKQHSSSISSKNINYIKKSKESELFVYLNNYNRSLLLNDKDLIRYLYLKIISLLILSINKRHLNNSLNIINVLGKSIFSFKKSYYIEFLFSSVFSVIIGKSFYFFEKKWRNYYKIYLLNLDEKNSF